MNRCDKCGGLLDFDYRCENGCKQTFAEPSRPAVRPPEWPTHCEGCGREFRPKETYCYNL